MNDAHAQPAPELLEVPVRAAWPEARGMTALRLDGGPSGLAARHTVPGQVVRVRLEDGRDAYFALASAPGTGPDVDLLVKHGPAVADAVGAAKPGDVLRITPPFGKGFSLDRHRGHDVLLFATGSGIAAIRSGVEHVLRQRDQFGRVVLFVGARAPTELAYRDDVPRWRAGGVEVEATVSRGGDDWTGPVCYVQDRFEAVSPSVDRAVACVCGRPEMQDAMGEALARHGLPPSRLLTNF